MESNDKLEQLLKQMYAQETLHDDDIDTSDIIDEEWVKFETEHFGGESSEVRKATGRRALLGNGKKLPLHKIAAMFVGLLMLSGIAYAAVHIISSHLQKAQEEQAIATTNAQRSTSDTQTESKDSTQMKPIVYEDTELITILDDVATFYQVEPVYKNEATKHIRLYFTWDKKQSIDNIIDTFNKFERINITRYDKILIVE